MRQTEDREWIQTMDQKFVIKDAKNRYYVFEVQEKGFSIVDNMRGAELFESIEIAESQFTKLQGYENREDYIILQYSWDISDAEEEGDDVDYEKAIMSALRKGDADRFGL
jgi:hypothetical protein